MAKKYIILDTETTGLHVKEGHRVIEIGAVLLNDRQKSEDHFHTYLNPMRLIDDEATQVHGITNEDLNDKPLFEEIAEEFLEFVDGSTLVIHNAQFDVGFLDNELNNSKLSDIHEFGGRENWLVTAYVRDNDSKLANGDTELEENDHVKLIVKNGDVQTALSLLGIEEKKELQKVIIIGASRASELLAQRLYKKYDVGYICLKANLMVL